MKSSVSSGAGKCRPAILWSAVRRDYETSLIGLRALARRYGIRSDNQIRRRRRKEGWQRDKAAIVARLWASGDAATAAPPDVTTADGRARLRGQIMRQQFAVGEEMCTLGRDLLRQINVVTGDDQQQAEAAACLLRAGLGTRGSLSGLLRTTAELCVRGVRIEWDILGEPRADAVVQEKAPSGGTT
jgi:hypothetical protein